MDTVNLSFTLRRDPETGITSIIARDLVSGSTYAVASIKTGQAVTNLHLLVRQQFGPGTRITARGTVIP